MSARCPMCKNGMLKAKYPNKQNTGDVRIYCEYYDSLVCCFSIEITADDKSDYVIEMIASATEVPFSVECYSGKVYSNSEDTDER